MTNNTTQSMTFREKLRRFAASIGPGIFIIGYIIGTGSVTSMASSGAKYGMSMTWALALSCFFTYIMIVSISRTTIVTGETIIFSFRKHMGSSVAIFIIFSLMMTVTTSIIGVTAIATDIVREWTRPLTASGEGVHPAVVAAAFIAILYYLFLSGSHALFLRAMAILVAVMGLSFVLTMFIVVPSPVELIKGLAPRLPHEGNTHLLIAALVGTTMANVCIITRSYLVSEKGWTLDDLREENRDSMVSLTLTFIVSAAIIACAAGTMYPNGIVVKKAIDMVMTLKPLAGNFATTLFVLGITAAALSSLFPNYCLGPWLVCDYLNIPRRMDRPLIRIAVFLIACLGFVVPVFGGSPVVIMIASQAVSPVTMPLFVLFFFILLNKKSVVGKYRNPLMLNIALIVTFVFSLFMAYSAILGLIDFFKSY